MTLRASLVVSLSVAAGICAFAMAAGVSRSMPAAFAVGVLAAAAAGWALWTRALLVLDDAAAPRGLRVLSAVATVVALVQLGLLTVFMVDPARVACSTVPGSAWEVRHSCLSAYFVAGEALDGGQDIYDGALYNAPEDTGFGPRKARMLGRFGLDVYEYPPPFLLAPRLISRLAGGDFFRLRPLWFGLCASIVLVAMLAVARRMGPVAGTRALLLLPLAWIGYPMMSTLQKGNIQLVVVALAMLALLLFETRRWAMGALLLAYATVSKLYPGMLVVYMLARRQWRATAWTAAMSLALVALTLWGSGWPPFFAFLEHLPKLLSGEAFPALRNPGPVAINVSVPGLVLKARLFGMPGTGFGGMRIAGWIFTVLVLWATYRAARRPVRDDEKPLVWLAVLILATLRSPFLPQTYGVLPALWALTLLAATYAPTARTLALVVLAVVACNVYWPQDWPMDPRLRATVNMLLPQAATIALAILALRRRIDPEPSTLKS